MSNITETNFKSLFEVSDYFKDELSCIKHFQFMRWGGKPVCPHCEHEKVYKFSDEIRFKCASCRKIFNVRTNSIFGDSKIPMRKWFFAIYIATSHKKGISSYQLARDLSITQKTAWFMLHRVRELVKQGTGEQLQGTIEIDEVYMGGKVRNAYGANSTIAPPKFKKLIKKKTPVLGMIERGGRLITMPITGSLFKDVLEEIYEVVEKGATIYTDEHKMYKSIGKDYKHDTVHHSSGEYVRGIVHTQSIEGFWGLFKRGVYGIYHQITPKHMSRYCDEFTFRYNTRTLKDSDRFNLGLRQCNNTRLRYADLIKKVEVING